MVFEHKIRVTSQNLETLKTKIQFSSFFFFFLAMKVAMGMQKQITAKRGQIDALQSKIQFLEEAMTNANKVSACAWSGEGQRVYPLVSCSTE